MLEEILRHAQSITLSPERTELLTTLVSANARLGKLDAALTIGELLPTLPAKRSAFLSLAVDSQSPDDLVKIVGKLIADDGTATFHAGRFAQQLLEKSDVKNAFRLLELTATPFENERARYRFFSTLLDKNCAEEARDFFDNFPKNEYKDWAILAYAKFLMKNPATRDRADEIAEDLSTPQKKSWLAFESGRDVTNRTSDLVRAVEILRNIEITEENAEPLAVQLRVVGKDFYQKKDASLHNIGAELLEYSESAIAAIKDSFAKIRSQLFLTKVLVELGLLPVIGDYFDWRRIEKPELSPTEQSRLTQWYAEISRNEKDWAKSAEMASLEPDESRRTERLVQLSKRYVAEQLSIQKRAADAAVAAVTGDPEQDAVILSGEDFESCYFTPFAIEGCGC